MSAPAGDKNRASSAFHIVAGLGSGATSAVLLQPADLLKTRVQQSAHAAYSIRHALSDILRQPHPIRSLWRGVTPSVLRTGCGSALYFGLLNHMRQYAARLPPVVPLPSSTSFPLPSSSSSSALPRLSNVANLTTGALARVVAGLCVNPITVLKVRYESTHFAYTSLSSAARDIWTREGPRGFFAGFGATAARDAPYAGLYVLVYEQAKSRLSNALHSRRPAVAAASTTTTSSQSESRAVSSVSINFASGVIAAVAATTLTNPFDAIKTRLQLDPNRYRNMICAARMMLQQEGVRSMFSGLSMRIGRKALSSAFTWTVYEELIRRAERALV